MGVKSPGPIEQSKEPPPKPEPDIDWDYWRKKIEQQGGNDGKQPPQTR